MTNTDFDWNEFEDELVAQLQGALALLGQQVQSEPFYVVALYGVYRELDGLLSLPLLGANTDAEGPEDAQGDFWAERWNPHGWAHTELEFDEAAALALEKRLTAEATKSTSDHWRRVQERYDEVLVRVAGRLRAIASEALAVTESFVCFVFDEAGGPALAKHTIEDARFDAVFTKAATKFREQARVAALSPEERAAFLVGRLGLYDGISSEDAQVGLVSLGEVAVPLLLPLLDNKENGWIAAKLLGDIGIATPEVLGALRDVAPRVMWAAVALGMLCDDTWLLRSTEPGVAVRGLTARLRAISTKERTSPLSYGSLESFLEGADSAQRMRVEEELKPGCAYNRIDAADVDEALRGLTSEHDAIRWHAAAILGKRELGDTCAQRILPALAVGLEDSHPWVRRLALLSLSRWKQAAAPYAAAMVALAEDPDEVVRRTIASLKLVR